MRGFFDVRPYIDYDGEKIKDIFARVRATDDLAEVFQLYEYIVQDGQTPELLAYEEYGDSERHWIILLVNGIIDPYFEWVMSSQEVEAYTERKYGDIHGFNHYEDEAGEIVYDDRALEPNLYNLIYVTNIDHEIALNEKRRTIKMMPFEFVKAFEEMYEGKL